MAFKMKGPGLYKSPLRNKEEGRESKGRAKYNKKLLNEKKKEIADANFLETNEALVKTKKKALSRDEYNKVIANYK
tara:strand:- start:44 stop:271 length:228 start_codon:yes stop_codon:yes gene_type:complete